MKHPNYNHLLYFWMVVRDGGVARAAEALHITPQTISGQIKLLEAELDGRLLEKKGRRVLPTELGLTVYEYADEIFSRGQDLIRVLQGRYTTKPAGGNSGGLRCSTESGCMAGNRPPDAG